MKNPLDVTSEIARRIRWASLRYAARVMRFLGEKHAAGILEAAARRVLLGVTLVDDGFSEDTRWWRSTGRVR